jgi:hypothetical protein
MWLAQFFRAMFSGTDEAFAAGKGRVALAGAGIAALPMGGKRFKLTGVPAGAWTLSVTTPDGAVGAAAVNFPEGGVMALGPLTVFRNGRLMFRPPFVPELLSSSIKARGVASGLASPASAAPPDGACPTFTVAGVTFCFDRQTKFDPPLTPLAPFANGQNVEVKAVPAGDPTSTVFRALRLRQNSGFPAEVQNTIRIEAPLTDVGAGTLTVFGGTSDAPDAHAITFFTDQAKIEPPPLRDRLAVGLLVDIKGGPVSVDTANGRQSSTATRVKLERIPPGAALVGDQIEVRGAVSSLQPSSKLIGLSNDRLIVQVTEATRFEEPLTSFESIAIGQVLEVEVLLAQQSGAPPLALSVALTEREGLLAVDTRGTVSGLDPGRKTFSIAGLVFCYDCRGVTTEFLGMTATDLGNGQFVEVAGTTLAGGMSAALKIEPREKPLFSSSNDNSGQDDRF